MTNNFLLDKSLFVKRKCYFYESDPSCAFDYGFNGFLVSKNIGLDSEIMTVAL